MKELIANLCHEQWSGWMVYLFSKCIDYKPDNVQAEEGALIIPKWAVDRWHGQLETDYPDLSTDEMNSDRKEADKFIALLNHDLRCKIEQGIKNLSSGQVDVVRLGIEQGGTIGHYGRSFIATCIIEEILKEINNKT